MDYPIFHSQDEFTRVKNYINGTIYNNIKVPMREIKILGNKKKDQEELDLSC
jgi:hypothetical protein